MWRLMHCKKKTRDKNSARYQDNTRNITLNCFRFDRLNESSAGHRYLHIFLLFLPMCWSNICSPIKLHSVLVLFAIAIECTINIFVLLLFGLFIIIVVVKKYIYLVVYSETMAAVAAVGMWKWFDSLWPNIRCCKKPYSFRPANIH